MNAPSLTYTPQIATNSDIDFTIWLLIKEGIRIPPFAFHASYSQTPPFDSNTWHTWLRRIIRQFDGRLRFKDDSILSADDQIAQLQLVIPMVSNIPSSDFDWDTLSDEYSLENAELYQYRKANYIQALADWGSDANDVPENTVLPPDLFEGESSYQQKLHEYWNEFTTNPNRTADQLFDEYLIPPIDIVAEQDNIIVYLIHYTHNVTLYVKPNTILVSVPPSGKIERDEFISRIQQAIVVQT